jgi:hypothetical protein
METTEDAMRFHKTRTITVAVFGLTALAWLAPVFAEANDRHRSHRSRGRVVHAAYNHGIDHWCERDYYYEDPYCGIVNSHVSKLTAHYDRRGHPPIVHMIDLHSGRVRNTYARRHDEWRKVRNTHSCSRSCDHDHGRFAWSGC